MQPAYHISKPWVTPITASEADIPPRPTVRIEDLEFQADNFDPARVVAAYREHGAVVIRGLFSRYMEGVRADIEVAAQQAIELIPQAQKVPEGWQTPDGTLLLPAPAGFSRAQQLMVLRCNYRMSANVFMSALDPVMGDLAEVLVGPDVELFMDGQVLYKEPVGGHPKHLHQDSAYFEHLLDGPMAVLNYVVDTDLVNGALHVVPGSHRMGLIPHVDTFSHLGLDPQAWPWERALPICGKAGDAIFFHVHTIHGSKENHSNASRPVCIHRYRNAYDYTVVSATGSANRAAAESPEAKAAAAAKRKQQQGLMIRGFRRHQTEQP
jgi:phytanoyl-CoA hydroxylase